METFLKRPAAVLVTPQTGLTTPTNEGVDKASKTARLLQQSPHRTGQAELPHPAPG